VVAVKFLMRSILNSHPIRGNKLWRQTAMPPILLFQYISLMSASAQKADVSQCLIWSEFKTLS